MGCEQGYQFVAPAAHGGVADLVAAGHVGDALVVAEYGEHDDDDPSGCQTPPAGADLLQVAAQQIGAVFVGFPGHVDREAGDLRHAGISFWLYSGVDPAECARRAGQSIEVLFRHYAKFLDGVREQANRLIEQSMKEWDRVSQGAAPEG
ncbi:hypothetical protein [Streptomyces sp. 769]|uniref:hypothetical protein n=1 Tax=Streptomyces sp. 769 TaxID=1262452 RepID=UPI001EF116C3|nr:hypothetical protein [Streptomyces sp. 769]